MNTMPGGVERENKVIELKDIFKQKEQLTTKEEMKLVWKLSVPAIMAQITSIIMQYIDAGMVGSMGADASASIGLVSTSTWLLGGLVFSSSVGFSVQVAQYVGAGNSKKANQVVKIALVAGLVFAAVLALFGASISGSLPGWLGAGNAIRKDASSYFFIYSMFIPAMLINNLAGSMLQCSGNMRTPSILNSMMCVLDVIFNAFFIFPSRNVYIGNWRVFVPGLNLQVTGAALGTAAAEVVIALLMLFALYQKSSLMKPKARVEKNQIFGIMKRGVTIAFPKALEHSAICGAMVAVTRIVAPLGTVAIAANSFAVTAESLCYMPGYGISAAATTLVGQCIGAKEKILAKRFAWMTVFLGMAVMAANAALMYIFSPELMAFLTPDERVQALGVAVLRIEVFAEPLYAASIVASGALQGAGDTLIPCILNLVSIWGIRITLSLLLVRQYGLKGVWMAMCIELCGRGILLLIRLLRGKWLR